MALTALGRLYACYAVVCDSLLLQALTRACTRGRCLPTSKLAYFTWYVAVSLFVSVWFGVSVYVRVLGWQACHEHTYCASCVFWGW